MTVVVDSWGWRAGWRVLAVGAAALIIPVSLLMRRAPEDHGLYPDGKTADQMAAGQGRAAAADFASSFTRREAMHTPSFYLIVLAFGLFGLSIPVMLLQTIPYLTDAGFSRAAASLMITVTSVPALVTKPMWGVLIDRANPTKLAVIGAVFTGVSLVLIVVAVRMEMRWLVYTGFFGLGCGWGGLIPLQEVVWASYFGRRYLGAVRSAALPLALLLSASAPILTTLYFDRVGNYDGALLTVALLNVLAAGLLLCVRKPTRPARPA
jgi:cyanate permease